MPKRYVIRVDTVVELSPSPDAMMGLLSVLSVLCCLSFVYSNPLPRYACTELQNFRHRIGLSSDVHFNASLVDIGDLAFPNMTEVNSYAICRIVGTIAYGEEQNDTLNFEVWLPDSTGYNGRYMSVGRCPLTFMPSTMTCLMSARKRRLCWDD